jgi:hypothetical protein
MNVFQLQFIHYRPFLKLAIKGKKKVDEFAEKIGVCTGTMYRYLAGTTPSVGDSKLIVEEGLKILNEQKINYDKYEQSDKYK